MVINTNKWEIFLLDFFFLLGGFLGGFVSFFYQFQMYKSFGWSYLNGKLFNVLLEWEVEYKQWNLPKNDDDIISFDFSIIQLAK